MAIIALRSQIIGRNCSRVLSIFQVNWKIIYILIAAVFFVSLIFHVILVNGIAGGVYLVKKHDMKADSMREENRMLEIRFAGVNFLGDIKERAKMAGFERTATMTYKHISRDSLVLSFR